MKKKKINTDGIMNELAESVFFRSQPTQPDKEVKPKVSSPSSDTVTQQDTYDPVPLVPRTGSSPGTGRAVPPVLPVPPKKRVMKQRHPFDIYQDQYDTLKHLADEERRNGGVGSMSAMVREGIDKIIAERSKK